MAIYTLKSVKTKEGEIHHMHDRLVGQNFIIRDVEVGKPLMAFFEGDDEWFLRTSTVEAHNHNWKKDKFIGIQTKNSVYTFIEKSEDEAKS